MPSKSDLIWQIRAQQDLLKKDIARIKSTMKRTERSMNSIGKKINMSLRGAFGVFTAGLVFRNIGRTIATFEKQMDKVAAVSGASATEIKRLKEEAIELGRVSKFTASEIGKLQEELAKKGFDPQQISASTDAIRQLATVADSELGEAASSLAGTLKGFNLEAEESNRVANVMAESFAKSSLDLEKFTVATANSGAIANALGVSLETNTARLASLVDANIDASKAGTDLRKIYVELNKQGIDYNEALQKVLNSSDKVATATKLVGIRSAAALVILAEQRGKVEQLNRSLSDNQIELSAMVAIMEDNLLTDLDKLKSAWEGFILALENGEGTLGRNVRKIVQFGTFLLDLFTPEKTKDETIADQINKDIEDLLKTLKSGEPTVKDFAEQIDRLSGKTRSAQAPNLTGIGLSGGPVLPSGVLLRPELIDNTEFLNKLSASYAEINNFILAQGQALGGTIISSTADAISGFASGVVVGGIEKGFLNIATVFAEGIERIGKQLILYGVTMIAAKKALKNPFANPGTAIAAGTAAVLASRLLKSTIASASAGISSGLSGGAGGFTGGLTQQSVKVELEGELKFNGKEFVYGLNQIQNRNSRLRSG